MLPMVDSDRDQDEMSNRGFESFLPPSNETEEMF